MAQSSFANKIIRITSAEDIPPIVENLPPEAVIFFDIDDTVITPVSVACRGEDNIIDAMKLEAGKYKNFPEILSNWRLQRKVILVNKNISGIIKKLKEKHAVYGLTKMDVGQFGNIPSMEQWRYNELKSLGIEFSENEDYYNHNPTPNAAKTPFIFYKGIFVTGVSKSTAIAAYIKEIHPSHIVLIDDREEHINDMQDFCEKKSISYVGILYKEIDRLPIDTTSNTSKFQKDYLIKHTKWLEDEAATREMGKK